MQNLWQLQDAKSKFSELVQNAMNKGPQFVTRRGQESVVVISIQEYKKLRKPKGSLLSFFEKAPKVNLDIKRDKSKDRDVTL